MADNPPAEQKTELKMPHLDQAAILLMSLVGKQSKKRTVQFGDSVSQTNLTLAY